MTGLGGCIRAGVSILYAVGFISELRQACSVVYWLIVLFQRLAPAAKSATSRDGRGVLWPATAVPLGCGSWHGSSFCHYEAYASFDARSQCGQRIASKPLFQLAGSSSVLFQDFEVTGV